LGKNNGDTKRQANDEDYLTINSAELVTVTSWSSLVISWASIENAYKKATAELVGIIHENFPSPHIYKLKTNKDKIKRAILAGIPEYDEIINVTNQFKGSRRQTPEQKDLMKKRNAAMKTIEALYHKFGNETYGDEYATLFPVEIQANQKGRLFQLLN